MRNHLLDVNATAHYRQRARRLERNEARLEGIIAGALLAYVCLVIWQVIDR